MNYDKESHTRFRRSFEANYPELCKERKIIVIDCTVITNPEHDRWLRDHLGTHPQTWAQVLAHKNFETSHRGLAKLSTTRKNLVITVCKSGCHRSLASSNSITPVIKDRLYGGDPKDTCVKTTDLQKQHHFDEKCGMCSLCTPGQKANDANRISAFRLLEPIIPKGKVPEADREILSPNGIQATRDGQRMSLPKRGRNSLRGQALLQSMLHPHLSWIPLLPQMM